MFVAPEFSTSVPSPIQRPGKEGHLYSTRHPTSHRKCRQMNRKQMKYGVSCNKVSDEHAGGGQFETEPGDRLSLPRALVISLSPTC
jgi:hypothetical protein